jgi:hypothetical protein
VAFKNGTVAELIQVCFDLNPDNLDREINGLLAAMQFFDKQKSIIITFKDSDRIEKDGHIIDVVPAFEYLGIS